MSSVFHGGNSGSNFLGDVAPERLNPQLKKMVPSEITFFVALFSIVAGGLIGRGISAYYYRLSSKRQKAENDRLRRELYAAHKEEIRLQNLNLRLTEASQDTKVRVKRDETGNPEALIHEVGITYGLKLSCNVVPEGCSMTPVEKDKSVE